MEIYNLGIRVLLEQVVTHSMHQVSFTQTHAAIQEERVVTVFGIVRYLPGAARANWLDLPSTKFSNVKVLFR
jgi:hypothetical protein